MKTSRLVVSTALAMFVGALPAVAHAQLFEDQGADALDQGCSGNGCWTNYVRMTDIDGDDDLDLIAINQSGFFLSTPLVEQELVVWLNNGDGTFGDKTNILGETMALRQIAIGDVDDDGDVDVYLPNADSGADRLMIQTAPGVFEDQASTRLPANTTNDAGFTRMGDFDGDGDLDIVVGNGYQTADNPPAFLLFNDGDGVFTAASTTTPTSSSGTDPDDVDVVDVDGDFDLDLLINVHQGQNAFWINDGAGNFTERAAPALSANRFHYGPVFCDVDGDDDLDMFVDNAATTTNFFEQLALNDGAGNFTDATNRISGNTGEDDNLVACIDYDGDGDFDFVVGALSSNERVFNNDGSGNFTFVEDAQDGPEDPTLWMEFGDLNGDDRLDLFTGQGEGNPEDERIYFGSDQVAVDTRAPHVRAVEEVTLSSSAETVVRFAISDNATTDEGPRLSRAYVLVGDQQIEAKFIGGDVFRAVVPATSETTFKVCAVDRAGNAIDGCSGGGEGGGNQGGNGQGGEGNGASSPSGGNAADGGGSEGGGGSGADGDGGDDGCGCSVPTRDDRHAVIGSLALLGLGLLLRSRRSRA